MSEPTTPTTTPVVLMVNGERREVTVDPGTPLLWVLRDELSMVGTKFGCGMALCGACTVQIDGVPARSCSTPVGVLDGRAISTIEGLSQGDELHPLQRAWVAENVPQCGYCQSGQLMAAEALLRSVPSPTDDDIDQAMSGNICRCGTYVRIKKAIKRAAAEMNGSGPKIPPPDERLGHVPKTAQLPIVHGRNMKGSR
jgi:isoquinoline 1-oxidoreductase alpha subunit